MDDFHLQNGILYHFNALYVPRGERIEHMREVDTSKIVGYFAVWKTLYDLERYVYWSKTQDQVSKYIRGCSLCCTSKMTSRKLSLYHPLPLPTPHWECISMDFIGELPMTKKGHDYLFIIMDIFSEICVLIPCKMTIIAQDTIKLLFSHIWVHFELPTSIVSNRDSTCLKKNVDMLRGKYGYKVEEKYYLSSSNKWTNQGSK